VNTNNINAKLPINALFKNLIKRTQRSFTIKSW